MNLLFKYIAGSHLYKLNTPQSDNDFRGVFLNDNILQVVGIEKTNSINKINDEEDLQLWEFSNYIQQLRKGGTAAWEGMFAPDWAMVVETPVAKYLRESRYAFLDTFNIRHSLKGYIFGEKRLYNGERTGRLGEKRRDALEQYGKSYKNGIHLVRLLFTGVTFLESGDYPIVIQEYDYNLHEQLLYWKLNPSTKIIPEIDAEIEKWERWFNELCENPKVMYHEDTPFIKKLVADVYQSSGIFGH
jgi:predicted nucleotidyltransferase